MAIGNIGSGGNLGPIHQHQAPARPPAEKVQAAPSDLVTLGATPVAKEPFDARTARANTPAEAQTPSLEEFNLAGPGAGSAPARSYAPASIDGANIAGISPQKEKGINRDELTGLNGLHSPRLEGLYSKKPLADMGFGFASFGA